MPRHSYAIFGMTAFARIGLTMRTGDVLRWFPMNGIATTGAGIEHPATGVTGLVTTTIWQNALRGGAALETGEHHQPLDGGEWSRFDHHYYPLSG